MFNKSPLSAKPVLCQFDPLCFPSANMDQKSPLGGLDFEWGYLFLLHLSSASILPTKRVDIRNPKGESVACSGNFMLWYCPNAGILHGTYF